MRVGQRIPDYGGKSGYLECFHLEKNEAIGYTSTRGKLTIAGLRERLAKTGQV